MIATATGQNKTKRFLSPNASSIFKETQIIQSWLSSLKIVVQKTTIMGLQSKLRNGLSDMFDEEIST
jgi:hypothetical protein